MLDVERRQDMDPGVAQLLDVLPALRMAAGRRVGMGEFVDQRDRGLACQHGVDVKLVEAMSAVIDRSARQDFEWRDERLGLSAAMCFDDADHNVETLSQHLCAFSQHLKGLADPGCRAEKYLQPPARFLLGSLEQRLRRRAGGIVHLAEIVAIRSSCRLSSNTLTCGFADDAKQRIFNTAFDKRPDLRLSKPARLGHPRDLRKSRLGTQIGIEPRGGSGDQVRRNIGPSQTLSARFIHTRGNCVAQVLRSRREIGRG